MSATASPDALPDVVAQALNAPSLCHAFQLTAAAGGDRIALRLPDDSVTVTWTQYAQRVRDLAEGLASLGVQDGGAVALLLANRPEVYLADTAAIHLGAAAFSIYFSNPAEDIVPLLANSGAKVLITETQYLDRVLETRELHPDLEHIVVVDGDGGGGGGDVTFDELAQRKVEGFDFDARWQGLSLEHVVTLVYTSGTTGAPKGVQHTHDSLLYGLRGLQDYAPVTPNGRLVSFLPMAHIAERWISHYAMMAFGHTVTCCPDPKQLAPALAGSHPTRLFAVPRIYEKLGDAVHAMMAKDPDGMLAQAFAVGLERVRAEQKAGGSPSHHDDDGLTDEQRAALAAVRERLGLDCLEWCSVAAAPSSVGMLETFHALGVPIAELWGMSECVYTTQNPPQRIRLGSIGSAVPGVEVKVADDGEILVRGRNVMRAYRNDEERTAETFDADGWLLSGDVVAADDDGYLRIIDRKKELIINSAGKNMPPQKIEMAVRDESPLIAQVVAIGDGRLYVTALIVLDEEECRRYGEANGVPGDVASLSADETVQGLISEAVARGNAKLARVEQIKTHTVLPGAWAPGGDEVTPTMKLKRKPIDKKYAAEIDALYAT